MSSISARELREHFGRPLATRRPVDYFGFAAGLVRTEAVAPTADTAVAPSIESLMISADAMPHHYVARAVIYDLQPSQLVAAIMAVEREIKKTYPRAHRSGWRAACDGIYLYFYAWTRPPVAAVLPCAESLEAA